MSIKTVAIQSPGDMGHGIGRVLAEGGYHVVSALEGRSERTRGLAKAAGIEDIGPLSALFEHTDVVLSIMRPDRALGFVEALAALAGDHGGRPVIVDLNAVAPSTGRASAAAAEAVGLSFIDGGIIGGPPRPGSSYTPRLYISGPRASELLPLNEAGLDFRVLGEGIGAGSAIKMCYAALTKGLTAIGIHSMVTAQLEGVDGALMAELAFSQKDLLRHLERGLPDMCPKAYRWVGEMEEISKTHVDGGLPGDMFLGAAKIYAQVEASPLGAEIVEDRKLGKTAGEVARILAENIGGRDKAAQ